MSNPSITLSHIDILALIKNQGDMTSAIAGAIMARNPNATPDHLVAATNRLSDLVGSWVGSLSQQVSAETAPASAEAA